MNSCKATKCCLTVACAMIALMGTNLSLVACSGDQGAAQDPVQIKLRDELNDVKTLDVEKIEVILRTAMKNGVEIIYGEYGAKVEIAKILALKDLTVANCTDSDIWNVRPGLFRSYPPSVQKFAEFYYQRLLNICHTQQTSIIQSVLNKVGEKGTELIDEFFKPRKEDPTESDEDSKRLFSSGDKKTLKKACEILYLEFPEADIFGRAWGIESRGEFIDRWCKYWSACNSFLRASNMRTFLWERQRQSQKHLDRAHEDLLNRLADASLEVFQIEDILRKAMNDGVKMIYGPNKEGVQTEQVEIAELLALKELTYNNCNDKGHSKFAPYRFDVGIANVKKLAKHYFEEFLKICEEGLINHVRLVENKVGKKGTELIERFLKLKELYPTNSNDDLISALQEPPMSPNEIQDKKKELKAACKILVKEYPQTRIVGQEFYYRPEKQLIERWQNNFIGCSSLLGRKNVIKKFESMVRKAEFGAGLLYHLIKNTLPIE